MRKWGAFVGVIVLWCGLAVGAGMDDWSAIEKILQRSGQRQGNIFQVLYPRTDLNVTSHGITLHPSMGLTSWVAFKKKGKGGEVFGEIVLLKKELSGVLQKLKAENMKVMVQQAAMRGSKPPVTSIFFAGTGDPVTLVWGVTPALSATGVPMGPPAEPSDKGATGEEWKSVERVLGKTGEPYGRTFRVLLAEADRRRDGASLVNGGSEVRFQRQGKRGLAIGMFALAKGDVPGVVAALERSEMSVLGTCDNAFFDPAHPVAVHFSGAGEVLELARGVRKAWEQAEGVRGK